MEGSAGKDLEVKRSAAANDDALCQSDDLLIAFSVSSTLTVDPSSGPGNETSLEQLGTVENDGDKSVDMDDTGEHIDEMPKLLETSEPDKSGKNVKFNLRKSLAWDSAFFTSDGVLDADELSTMIEGGEKSVRRQLPGIEEEVCRSMDSISTLASDNLSLNCLEAELFEDIRASIQKSNRPSNLNNSSIKVSSGKRDSQAKVSSSSKKVDLDSGKRPAARIKDNNTSSIPQPKISSRLNLNSTSTLTKRASLSASHAKKDQDTAKQAYVTQKGALAIKRTTTQGSKVTGPCRGVPKPSLSSKSSSLKTEPMRPSSSCSNSSSCSSGNDIKTTVNLSRKKADSSKNGGKCTAGLTPKTPSRISMKNKAPSHANSRLSSHLVVPNLSSSISPANSISEWSSESSSSTSTINQCSQSRGSIDSSNSYRSLEGDTAVQASLSTHPTGPSSNQNGFQTVVVPPFQTGSLSRPPAVQPTGLRMPSPKIGFFDGGKSGARTPSRGIRSQSKLPTGASKTGATLFNPTSSNNVKFGKLPPPKTTAPPTNMKPNPHKTAPKPSQEQPSSKPKTETCLVTSDVSDHKTESSLNIHINASHNVDDGTNKQLNLGKKSDTHNDVELVMLDSSSEVCSNECFAVKDNKVDKSITDSSRTPLAVKKSVCDTNGTGIEVTEKTVNISFMDSQQNENGEVI